MARNTNLMRKLVRHGLTAMGLLALFACVNAPALSQTAAPTGGTAQNLPTGSTMQNALSPLTTTGVQAAEGSAIVATSAPYRLEWNGQTGTLTRDALAQERGQTLTLTYLHSDPGPKGYSRHLAWFLARDASSFSLLWCYLNDSGTEFWCWLYRYPSNQLTTLRFQGNYRFTAPAEPTPPVVPASFNLADTPRYAGLDFKYRDWTRRAGTLDSLALRPAQAASFADPSVQSTGTPAPPSGEGTPTRTLTGLKITPLHEINVGGGNGWRAQGWRELHVLARDATGDSYYLILYSNATRGYVVDLRRAQTWVADFGQTVQFTASTDTFGTQEAQLSLPSEVRVARYTRHEITLTSAKSYANPYTDVLLDADLRAPDGRRLRIPGFWDGASQSGNTWHVRFAPMQTGTWTWRTRSNDPELNGQEGTFNCITGEPSGIGFVRVNTSYGYRRHFALADGTPFLPSFVREPFHDFHDTGESGTSPSGLRVGSREPTGGPRVADAHATPFATPDGDPLPPTLQTFQRRVDGLAAQGFNRFTGGYLIDGERFRQKTQRNEGGLLFAADDPDRINPAYFQWMDRRLAYCNERGIAPDLGIGVLDSRLLAGVPEESLRRLWRYTLARYAAYSVCWNLFGREGGTPLSSDEESLVTGFAQLTQRYDPYNHLLTSVAAFAPSVPAAQPLPSGSQKPGRRPTARPAAASPTGANPPATPTNSEPATAGNDGNGYVVTPDPDTLQTLRSQTARANAPSVSPLLLPFAGADWLDVIALTDSDRDRLADTYRANKPVVVYEKGGEVSHSAQGAVTPATLDAARYALWETRMQGAYWAGNYRGDVNDAADATQTRWAMYCQQMFARTRYWRLAPHREMLGGPEESLFVRRRRRRAEAEQQKSSETALEPIPADGEKAKADAAGEKLPPATTPAPAGPIWVLADPAWEYMVYFERGGTVTLDLLEATGHVKQTWFNPRTGQVQESEGIVGGAYRTFVAPDQNDWVLLLSRR